MRKKNKMTSLSINSMIFFGLTIALLVGVIAGTITANFMDSAAYDSIRNYITSFLSTFDPSNINQKATFINSFYKYFRIIAVVWLSGFFLAGLIVISAIMLVKAFAYGFTTAALVKYFGFYGLVVAFNCYIPQNLFFLPAMFLTSQGAISLMFRRVTDDRIKREANDKGMAEYGFVLLIGFLCCIIAALFETYMTPILLEYIKPV